MKLAEPLEVRGRTIGNRLMMASMHTGLEEADDGLARMAAFYAARAAGGAGLIVTGGVSPNRDGMLGLGPAERSFPECHAGHAAITDAVHAEGGLILLQLLHAGRYSKHDHPVAPSPLRSPINRHPPRQLGDDEIERTIAEFAAAARLAREAGYDGVEIMGSEGYLLAQFLCARTNLRDDRWGGSWEHRKRLPLAVTAAVREALGDDGMLMFRLSVLDLVEGGMTAAEAVDLARGVEAAGADLIDSGIGWHESQVPTIMGLVPHGAFAFATRRIRDAVNIPVAACNRINSPQTAERLLADGVADLVSMARPWLADADFGRKALAGRDRAVNTCIACNQACLDAIFDGRQASCVVNPRACHETEIVIEPAATTRRIAVVGAGPGGLAAAATLAERGHRVTLFEAEAEPGGQFKLAAAIPGKQDYAETVRYFVERMRTLGAELNTGHRATVDDLSGRFDAVVLATGVTPRMPEIPGIDHPMVLRYDQLLRGAEVGERVAVIGAGGIGFDVADFLTAPPGHASVAGYFEEWSIDTAAESPGGLADADPAAPARRVWLCQRRDGRFGATLGKTTGWALRAALLRRGVKMLGGVEYRLIDDRGLHLLRDGEERLLEVDSVVVCAGQLECRELEGPLIDAGVPVHVIGGAALAAELDARRAIDEAVRLAARL